jgi:hypothetical protein
MKIFNVSVCIEINQIGEIVEHEAETAPPAPKPFNDDPLDKAEKMLDRYLEKANGVRMGAAMLGYAAAGDSTRMVENIRIAAASFEDLQEVLKKFHDTAKQLVTVPDSIVQQSTPSIG